MLPFNSPYANLPQLIVQLYSIGEVTVRKVKAINENIKHTNASEFIHQRRQETPCAGGAEIEQHELEHHL